MAQTSAKYAGTVANDAVGTNAWTNPTNAQGSNDSTIATSSVTSSNTTQRLKATNFGFTSSDIPVGSTINGFIIRIRTRAGTTNRAYTSELFAVKGGTTETGAGNLGEGSGAKWLASATIRSYGDASELFGLSWAQADVTSSGFGLSLRAAGSNTATTECSWFEIVVDYTAPVTHATSGALEGQGSEVVGSAARVAGSVSHDASGALTGQGASVSGSAARSSGVVSHATSGALTGQGSAVIGSAARERLHPTSGALTGQGATVAGSAARFRAHPTSGSLSGAGAVVEGSAARLGAPTVHATTGVLVGPGAQVVGAAARVGSAVTHETSGALVGQGSELIGTARNGIAGGMLFKRRPYHIEVDGERQYFTDPQAALEALRELREQEKPKPKKIRKRWQLVKTAGATVLVSSPMRKPAPSRADLESLDWVRDHAPASAQLIARAAQRDDEDDIELLLLSI